jgi:dolichol kinase
VNYAETSIESAYRIEITRKAIHLCSLSIPIAYFFIPRDLALTILVPAAVLAIAIDIGRYYIPGLHGWFYATFGSLLRPHESDSEKKRLSGASYVMISAALSVFFFPKLVAITGFAILIIGDMFAALVGRRYGRHKFGNKSLEGSTAFFLTGVIIMALIPKIEYRLSEYLIGVFSVAVGAIVEALPIPLDDNLSIPLAVGITMWACYHYLLPMVDVMRWG